MLQNTIISRIIEFLAVIFNLLFTWLYILGTPWCFLFGILGPVFLFVLCYQRKLYADAFLQLAYIGFAIFGYLQVASGWHAMILPSSNHVLLISLGLIITLVSGKLLSSKTDAQFPYIDSFTTAFALIATFLMMIPVKEAWLYFMVINTTSLFMYAQRKLYYGAFMFLVYLAMSIDGYFIFGWFS
ncbi:MAG: nicotinamide riboside transporter PnuC [Flavobacteriales bacterium]|jgi:nicotinamide mononucleotide transporter